MVSTRRGKPSSNDEDEHEVVLVKTPAPKKFPARTPRTRSRAALPPTPVTDERPDDKTSQEVEITPSITKPTPKRKRFDDDDDDDVVVAPEVVSTVSEVTVSVEAPQQEVCLRGFSFLDCCMRFITR